MEVIAVANQKEEVAKLQHQLTSPHIWHYGEAYSMIDLDPQGAATTGLGIDKWSLKEDHL